MKPLAVARMTVIPINRKTRSAQPARTRGGAAEVASALEFDILFGRLKPRERLVEDVLMQRFDAKRHVVRQALNELEHIGIVTREPNRGAAVRDFSAQEVEEICELREILQRRAAQRIPLPADPALIASLEEIQARHDEPWPRGTRARSIAPTRRFTTRCLPRAAACICRRRSSIMRI